MHTLDLDGSREIIEGIVNKYVAALDKSDFGAALDYQERLYRWAFPLAVWYLDKTKVGNTGGE